MKRIITVLAAALAIGFYLGTPAHAATTPGPSFATCPNLSGWYANPDEQSDLPEPTAEGLKFEGKDLIHHAVSTPLALADVHGGTFVASTAGKVVFKMETTNPYSTIIQNADGKFWSSRLAVDAPGGQNSPVDTVTDMIGSATKTGNPKYTDDTHVTTFGVGYWVEDGSTVVSSISFHGTTYPLTCPPETTSPSPSTSASHSASASPSRSTGGAVATSPSRTAAAASSGGLPVTGAPVGLLAGGGAAVLVLGAALLLLTWRRRNSFSA